MASEEQALQADDLVRKGVRLEAAGRKDEARAALEAAVSLAPDHAFGLLHLAIVLAGAGRFAEAAPHLRRALELRPESLAFHLFAGRVYFDGGEFDNARRAFDRALELNPANDLARNYRILTDWAAGAPDAPARFNPEAFPDSTPFLARLLALIEAEMKGRTTEYVDAATATPLIDRPRVAYGLWRAGLAKKQGDLAEAASFADMVLEMRPGLPEAVKFQRECREAALGVSRQQVAEEPASAEAHVDLASHLAEAEQYDEADRELAEARRLFAEGQDEAAAKAPEFLRLAARVAYGLGRIDEALELTQAGAEPGFSMAETHYFMGLCHLAQGRRQACFEEFERLVSKVWWAVPLRFREYRARRLSSSESRT